VDKLEATHINKCIISTQQWKNEYIISWNYNIIFTWRFITQQSWWKNLHHKLHKNVPDVMWQNSHWVLCYMIWKEICIQVRKIFTTSLKYHTSKASKDKKLKVRDVHMNIVHINGVHNDHEHKQEYLKSSVTNNDELDTNKYYFRLPRKNHLVCQDKWSLIYMLEVVFDGNK